MIRPYPPYREKFEAGGSYEKGTPDGARPGTFYYNAYDLPSRSICEETTLFMHEGEPGHHFQISLAQENKSLPAFMRFGGNTAYVEGWALYSESLGYPMNMYSDPCQRFGNLNDEMLRAMRLVVDTGIHAKGWTRDQAINYMLTHSGEAKTDATAEVERYIAIPCQATAYKIGQLTITRLREKAKAALGPKFDIREFHAQVLDMGALPMAILEAEDRPLDRGQKGELGSLEVAVRRFACTSCGACCNRSPEVELSEAAALADVFVFRLMFRLYSLPRTFESGRSPSESAEIFYQKKRLLAAHAARKYAVMIMRDGRRVEHVQYLMISALALDTRSGACAALSGGRCGIYDRRPLGCRAVPFHYSRADALAESDLDAFVATPGYACETGESAPVVLESGHIVDRITLQTRAASADACPA